MGFKGIEKGYVHTANAYIFWDDTKLMESPELKQSKNQSLTPEVPAGRHQLKVEIRVLYVGAWEFHSIESITASTVSWMSNSKSRREAP